jgi:hypothetical protein
MMTCPHLALTFSILLVFLAATQAIEPSHQFDPTSSYKVVSIEGFTVLVNQRLLARRQEAAEAIHELESQLKKINRAVQPGPLAELHKVRFWMELSNQPNKAAVFHPSEQWLLEHGYNPEKAGDIEIANAQNFVKWSREDQPWAAFHELAHSYHFRVLGEDSQDVLHAYQHAMDRRLYNSVEYVHGGTRKAYATENAKEYFAEISEAYFGKNDFFPFTRSDLKKHDPVGLLLMQQVWGQPRDGTSRTPSRTKKARGGSNRR